MVQVCLESQHLGRGKGEAGGYELEANQGYIVRLPKKKIRVWGWLERWLSG